MKNNLPAPRAERSWSQTALAERLGVSRRSVNAIEQEWYDPSRLSRSSTWPWETSSSPKKARFSMSSETSKVKISINGTAIVLAIAALVAFRAGAVQAAWALVWVYLASLVLVAAVIAWIGRASTRAKFG